MPPPGGGAEKDPRSEPPEGLTSVGSTGGAAGEGPSPVNEECEPHMPVCLAGRSIAGLRGQDAWYYAADAARDRPPPAPNSCSQTIP
jgi:hypothetical protein